jgi:hypothetical protein
MTQGRQHRPVRNESVSPWTTSAIPTVATIQLGMPAARAREAATWAGHTSVSFTLDRWGHLYQEADRALRDRLDRIHEAARR